MSTRLAEQGYVLTLSAAARRLLLEAALDPADGMRRVHRTVESTVLAPLLERPRGAYRIVNVGQRLKTVRVRRPSADVPVVSSADDA